MLRNRTTETLTAAALVAPFVLIYCWMFVYPTIRMAQLSFTDAPLIGAGHWVGLDNYRRMFSDRVFWTAVWNTSYFVLLTVVPGTAAALANGSMSAARAAAAPAAGNVGVTCPSWHQPS